MKLNILFVLTLLFFSCISWGYIPNSDYILDRTSTNHGSGIYLIDQKVTLYAPNQAPVEFNEQWLVRGERKLRVRVHGKDFKGEDFNFTFLYDSQKRLTIDSQGRLRKAKISAEFFEPLFYFKSVSLAKILLNKMDILPSSALEQKAKLSKIEDIKHNNESFLRLARANGTINYTFGDVSPDSTNLKANLWIEQDQFHIRKIRTPQKTEITADKYQRYRNNLWLAQNRQIRWDENRANITVTRVKNYSAYSVLKKRLWDSSLNPDKEPKLIAIIPENPLIVSFYKRFR